MTMKTGSFSTSPQSSEVATAVAAESHAAAASKIEGGVADAPVAPRLREPQSAGEDGIDVSVAAPGPRFDAAMDPPCLPEERLAEPERQAQEANRSALMAGLSVIAEASFSVKNVDAVLDRVDYLRGHPAESLCVQVLGADFAEEVAGFLRQLPSEDTLAFGRERFGDAAAELVAAHRAASLDYVGRQLLGGARLLGHLDAAQLTFGAQVLAGLAETAKRSVGDGASLEATLEALFDEVAVAVPASLLHADAGLVVDAEGVPLLRDGASEHHAPPTLAETIHTACMIAEVAGFEFLIGQFQRLLNDDSKLRLEQLNEMLTYLKTQKSGLAQHIHTTAAHMVGKEMAAALQQEKLNKSQECSFILGIFRAIAMVAFAVVTLVVAVIATPFTGGLSMALIVGVAAILSSVITFVTTLPQILQAFALLLGALGLDAAEEALLTAATWFEENVIKNEIFKWVTFGLQLACVAVSLVACVGSLSGAAGAVAELAKDLRFVTAAAQLVAGVVNIGFATASYLVQQEIAEGMKKLAELKAQLAKLELKIRELSLAIERLDDRQDRVRDSEQAESERDEKLRKVAADMAAAAAAMASAVNDFGR